MVKSNLPDARFIASFCTEHAEGNRHLVVSLPAPVNMQTLEACLTALSSQYTGLIIVVLVLTSAPAERKTTASQIRFFQNGKMILRCGSGSVAAAYYLHELKSTDVGSASTVFPMQLQTANSYVHVGYSEGWYYYETSTLPLVAVKDSVLQRKLLNRSVQQVYLVGGAQDYAILELANKQDLQRCLLNTRANALFTRRSLIVTTASSERSVDYYLRYFNPRYGAYEDAATGSANAMLAGLWQQRLRKRSVRGSQLSIQGGEFCVERIGGFDFSRSQSLCQPEINLPPLRQKVLGQARELTAEEVFTDQNASAYLQATRKALSRL